MWYQKVRGRKLREGQETRAYSQIQETPKLPSGTYWWLIGPFLGQQQHLGGDFDGTCEWMSAQRPWGVCWSSSCDFSRTSNWSTFSGQSQALSRKCWSRLPCRAGSVGQKGKRKSRKKCWSETNGEISMCVRLSFFFFFFHFMKTEKRISFHKARKAILAIHLSNYWKIHFT